MGMDYSNFSSCYKAYQNAYDAGNLESAKKFARMALEDAMKERNNTSSSSMKEYYQNAINELNAFLSKPTIKSKPITANGAGETNDQIKSKDWFDAPIPNLNIEAIAGLQDVRDAFFVNVIAPMSEQTAHIYKKYRGEERGLQVLLYGPPGTGKTYAVRCLAGHLKCKIAIVQIKDVMASLVGEGAKIIAEVFEQAKAYDKCIIFFDEIDAIASSRESDDSRYTKEQLTTLLTNMDGFTSAARPDQIRIVIAATNRPWALDSAVKRGGRFDTQIYVPLPDPKARKKLIELSLKKELSDGTVIDVPCAKDATIEWLVERTEGYSGADIKAIVRQASDRPLKREIKSELKKCHVDDCITRADFEYVFDRYINPTDEEDQMRFDAYTTNMDYDSRAYKAMKCRLLNDKIRKGIILEAFEEDWMKLIYTRRNRREYADLVSAEMLLRLEALKCGTGYNEAFRKDKCESILKRLLDGQSVEDHERDWFEVLFRNGFVNKHFARQYDLSFLNDEFYDSTF
ncbi:MAG: ATP-binding protein [Clostridia bacterium]|nr:ATP-binding protein [Clostridia bacterium]